MDRIMRRITMRVTGHSWYDPAQELYYYTNGEVLEAAESVAEFGQVLLGMLERAAAFGKEYVLKTTKMILELLEPATVLGGEWMGIALDMLAQYWGYHGDGERAASDVFEVELAEIFARHSSSSSSSSSSSGSSNSGGPCPTE